MKRYFDFTLKGRDWWLPFLAFWVPYVALYAAQIAINRSGDLAASRAGLSLLVNLAYMIILVLLQAVFTIVIMKIIVPKLSFDGNAFSFDGSVGAYVGLNIKGVLLTIITLSIWAPWYMRKITAYLASHTRYRETALEFLGKPGRLFKYFLLGVYLPVIAISVGLGLLLFAAFRGSPQVSDSGAQLFTMLVAFLVAVLMFVVLVPFIYLAYRWYFDVRWNDLHASWQTSFWPSCGMILGQLALTLVTLGIYAPAAILRLYRYFVDRTVLTHGEVEAARLGFDGSLGKGFGLIWGQSLLCIITLGVYIPWAYARVGRWVAGATFVAGG